MVETTVSKIRVGTKLLLGQYGVSADEIFPIMWLKATPNGDFIAAKVLDYICFDGRERQSADYNMRMFGNPDYGRSNILQFLNSQDESWWNPTHESDSPPDRSNVCNINDAYHDHCGFLYNFEEYEIDSLVRKLIHTPSGVRESLMRLPSYSDLVGDIGSNCSPEGAFGQTVRRTTSSTVVCMPTLTQVHTLNSGCPTYTTTAIIKPF